MFTSENGVSLEKIQHEVTTWSKTNVSKYTNYGLLAITVLPTKAWAEEYKRRFDLRMPHRSHYVRQAV